MSKAREDLDSFYQFAVDRLDKRPETPIDELLMEWHDDRDRDAINEAIRRGIEDVDAGRCRPAGEVMEEIRKKFGFGK